MLITEWTKKWLAKPASSLLGVDISSTYIKVAEVAWANQSYQLRGFHEKVLRAGESVVENLNQLVQEAKFKTRSACLGLEYSTIISKTAELDASLTEEEIEVEVNERAHQYFNYQPNELLTDFEIIGPAKQQAKLLELRWIAAKKQEVDQQLKLLSQVGITTAIVDIKLYALIKICQLVTQDQSLIGMIMLLHSAHGKLVMLVCNKKTVFFGKEIIQPNTVDELIEEVVSLIALMQGNFPGKNIDRILLSNIEISWQEKIKARIFIELADLVTGLRSCKWLQGHSDLLVAENFVSLGLAMRVDECQ